MVKNLKFPSSIVGLPTAPPYGYPDYIYKQYETALKTDKFVLIAHGSLEDTTHAKEILNRTQPETLEHHQ